MEIWGAGSTKKKKKIYPFTTCQQHLSHYLVVIAMCFFKFINSIYTFQIWQLRDWILNRALDFQQPPGTVFRGIIDPSIWRGSQLWARRVDNNPGRENIAISTVSICRSCLFFCIYAMLHCRSLHSLLQLSDCQWFKVSSSYTHIFKFTGR